MKPWVVLLGCVVFGANCVFLIFWAWIGHLHAVGPYGRSIDTYDAISLQITILGLVLAALAIGLAVASVFGYQAIRDSVFKSTMDYVNRRLDRHPFFSPEFQGMISEATRNAAVNKAPGEIKEEDKKL